MWAWMFLCQEFKNEISYLIRIHLTITCIYISIFKVDISSYFLVIFINEYNKCIINQCVLCILDPFNSTSYTPTFAHSNQYTVSL